MRTILGISALYHDSAACLVRDGEIVAAAQEERFTRKRHDAGFPLEAIQYCLKEGGVELGELSAIVFYDKPFLTFERLISTYLDYAPRGLGVFLKAMPFWTKEKLFLRKTIRKKLSERFDVDVKKLPPILFGEHHESHAASAFFPSPFEKAAVLCMDGVGEWATTSAWTGERGRLRKLWEIRFPHSIGLLYSAFTYYTGFKVNSGEYKVMGLAPYGKPTYVQAILEHLIDVKEDGTFRMNMEYFDYCAGLRMTNEKFDKIFGGPPRKPESRLTQREMDLAHSVQVVTEMIVSALARKIQRETGAKNLSLAGGVALNCVANGKLLQEGTYERIWIQPAAGDAGGAIGCALSAAHQYFGVPRAVNPRDSMKGAYLGPSFGGEEIESVLRARGAHFRVYTEVDMLERVAGDLADGKVVGWFDGRMEFGPRALGARSILGDARSPKMQSVMNFKIKHRESFRPFAPAVLREKVSDYFEMSDDSPYMLLVAPVRESRRVLPTAEQSELWGIELLNIPKSDIPAVTHVDYSARIQTVHRETNPRFYGLIESFDKKTGCPVLVNTSFNVRGEPIVCTPEDAYRCFMRTEMDTLVLGNYVLDKSAQPKPTSAESDDAWKKEFELD
jgi:carbamoyltransferase